MTQPEGVKSEDGFIVPEFEKLPLLPFATAVVRRPRDQPVRRPRVPVRVFIRMTDRS